MADLNDANDPQDIIERIRSEGYLLDIADLPEQIRRGAQNLQENLNNALDLLSKDLYSTTSHFILELIQNADDNAYPQGVNPQLIFRIAPDRISLTNNEVGFSVDNVKALCSVGKSSKEKKAGYIGEKGIGFKSVFTVSDAPEIHSNGFHFKFDRTDPKNLLGYVIPHWCMPSTPLDPDATTIILPAATGKKFDMKMLAGLEARLLLFLAKLRRITLESEDRTVTFHREDSEATTRLIARYEPNGSEPRTEESHFVRIAAELDMESVPDEKRPGILTSEMVLAFPVSADGAANPDPTSQVFAFLPIRQAGFKFAIQADFLLSSSREDILVNREWNQALRYVIAEVFGDAVETFKNNEALAFTYLSFVPSPDEISDPFFKPVVDDIINKLAQSESLPAVGGQWKLPSDLRIADEAFMDLFPPAVAMELFGFDYVDPRVQVSDDLLRRLGAKDLSLQERLAVFEGHGEWFKRQPLDWRGRFYAMLAEDDLNTIVGRLNTLSCIPTASGDLVTPGQSTVFFPLSRRKNYGFEQELTILDGQLYDVAAQYSSYVPRLFDLLKIRRDVAYDLITSHILPRHRGEAWKYSEHDALLGHLRYVKEKLDAYLSGALENGKSEDQAIETIRQGMWVGTKGTSEEGNWIFNKAYQLYLSKEYRLQFCIETLAGKDMEPARFISDKYLPDKYKDADTEVGAWRTFFERIGACISPQVVQGSGGNFKCSPELLILINSPQSDIRKALLECLDANWDKYTKNLYLNVVPRRATEFLTSLRSMQAPLIKRKRAAVPLNESYYRTQELLDVFDESPPYIDAHLADGRLLSPCLISSRPDASACLKRLSQLRESGGETIKQLQAIYRALERHWDDSGSHIRDELESKGLIRIRGKNRTWCKPSEAAWRSSTPFLDNIYPPLDSTYRDFSGFFNNKLGIPKELPTSKRVEALEKLDDVADVEERRREALAIYKRANRDLAPKFTKKNTPEWLRKFWNDHVILDHRGELVKNHASLYANDVPDIAELFLDDEDVSFFGVPPEEVPGLGYLIDAAHIQRISESVTRTVAHAGNGRTDVRLTSKVTRSAPHLARVLYASNQEVFDWAADVRLFSKLQKFKVTIVPDLTLQVNLGESYREARADIARQDSMIFIREGARSVDDLLAGELCRYFLAPDMLIDTFARVLMTEDANAVEEYLRMRHFGPLPADRLEAILADDNTLFSDLDQDSNAHEGEDDSDADHGAQANTSEEDGDDGSSANGTAANQHTDKPPANGPTQSSLGPSASPSPPRSPSPSSGGKDNPGTPINETPPGSPAPTPTPITVRQSPIDRFPGQGSGQDGTAPPDPRGWRGKGGNGGKRKSRPGRRAQKRTKSGRLLSYAASPGDSADRDGEVDSEAAEARKATSDAAVAYFIEAESARWKSTTIMPPNNPGYDVHAVAFDGVEEFIEIKGQSDAWTESGVALTPTELMTAQQKGERYWLCVVEHVHDEKRRTSYLVQNPYGSTQQFRFDSGWKSSAIATRAAPGTPEAGMRIEIPELGQGRVVSARKRGQFYYVHVFLDDGKQINRPFNPATMKLSLE